jgi:hypothetical protein
MIVNVKLLCKSKLTHVQFAGKQLFEILQSPAWLDFVHSHYRSSGEQIFEDFTIVTKFSNSNYPLISQCVLDMCLNGLANVTVQTMPNLGFLLDELFFFKVFKFITTNTTQLDAVRMQTK